MKRVLVTGARGFIGRFCPQRLAEMGYEVHLVSRRKDVPEIPGVADHCLDLFDRAGVRALLASVRPTHLLHLAWYAVPIVFWNASENLSWVQESINLMREFVEKGGQRIVVAGTCAEYDWSYGYCTEGLTPLRPGTLYGSSKLAFHSVLEAFSKRQGVDYSWGRVFWLYGPGEDRSRLVANLATALLRGEPALCRRGQLVRDYLYVEDVAAAFCQILNSGCTGPINIASGIPVSIEQIARAVAEASGRNDLLEVRQEPPPEGESPFVVANVHKLTREAGWSPRYTLTDGVAAAVAWWRGQLRAES